MIHNLSSRTRRVRLKPDGTNYTPVVAGTSNITSDYVDTLGYQGILFRVAFGAITSGAATSIKVTDCDTSGGSYSDVAGTAQTVVDTADNTCYEVEIYKPTKRYLKFLVLRATQNSAVDFLEAILYSPDRAAPALDATNTAIESFNQPIDGTA